MMAAESSPLRLPREMRRQILSQHFVGVIERMIKDGHAYSDVSVAKLIDAAGISRSAFYAFYDDKGDLLAAMAEVLVEEIKTAGIAWWKMPEEGDKADLREALRPAIEAFRQHYAMLKTVVEGSISDPRVREPYHRLIEDATSSLAQHIRDGQSRGTVAAGLDPERTARWLNLMNERALHYSLGGSSAEEAVADLAALTDIIWRTLYEGLRRPERRRTPRPKRT
ncbi:MAG: TetR/AcrR family transcriptional regulator [Mycobacterium sp.]|nr:MAG: TetR/AcrR family transcriptional regulator [Mycobacterium sp.]